MLLRIFGGDLRSDGLVSAGLDEELGELTGAEAGCDELP